MNNLPFEIMQKVVSHLIINDAANLSFVNRHLQKVISPILPMLCDENCLKLIYPRRIRPRFKEIANLNPLFLGVFFQSRNTSQVVMLLSKVLYPILVERVDIDQQNIIIDVYESGMKSIIPTHFHFEVGYLNDSCFFDPKDVKSILSIAYKNFTSKYAQKLINRIICDDFDVESSSTNILANFAYKILTINAFDLLFSDECLKILHSRDVTQKKMSLFMPSFRKICAPFLVGLATDMNSLALILYLELRSFRTSTGFPTNLSITIEECYSIVFKAFFTSDFGNIEDTFGLDTVKEAVRFFCRTHGEMW